jgi:hypothetical protein
MNFYNESKKIDLLLETMIKENPISSNGLEWLKFIRLVKVELDRLEEKIKDVIDVQTEEVAKKKCCEHMLEVKNEIRHI